MHLWFVLPCSARLRDDPQIGFHALPAAWEFRRGVAGLPSCGQCTGWVRLR